MSNVNLKIEDYLRDLSAIAPDLLMLKKSDRPIVRYEILSDSLVWSDEFPRNSSFNTDCLRFLFRYRTSLILGKPDDRYEAFWNEGQKVFPPWIGFSPERTSFNNELVSFYLKEKERVLRELDDGEEERPLWAKIETLDAIPQVHRN